MLKTILSNHRISISTFARIMGVSVATVHTWKKRGSSFWAIKYRIFRDLVMARHPTRQLEIFELWTIPRWIRMVMEAAEIHTAVDLAERTGLSRSTISAIMLGKTTARTSTIEVIDRVHSGPKLLMEC